MQPHWNGLERHSYDCNIDSYSFDVRSVKKTCVHIAHPDGRIIPLDTYNLFYRDGLEETTLAPLRLERELAEYV